jgi:CBS domain-containing protein
MKANQIMTSQPVCVTPDTPIQEAARLMKDQNVGMLPVVQNEGSKQLIGVITDRDITIRHVAEGHTSADCPVSEAMTDNVTTATPESDVGEVMAIMGREQVRRIPIVDERGELVGVVAQADVVLHARDDKKAEQTIEEISQPFGKHAG